MEAIAADLTVALDAGVPVIVYNAGFDLTLLEHELSRWQLPTLAERLGRAPAPVLDPLVLDRALDRVRAGQRKLIDLCQHYRVQTREGLHTAEVDVRATLEVLDCLVRAFPELSAWSLERLHEWQRARHREWAVELTESRAREGLAGPGPELEWLPLLQPTTATT